MLTHLDLTNFRSYRNFKLEIEQPLVVIMGPNAVGKTNLLESIYVASTTHSFRAKDSEIIHFGEDFYRVVASFENIEQEIRFVTNGDSHRKNALLSGVKKPLSSAVGINPVTIFEPNDMNLLTGPPSVRRKYLDSVLAQIDKKYLSSLSAYRKILKQRNSLLHQSRQKGIRSLDDQLFIWDLQLVEPATYIIKSRQEFIGMIAKLMRHYYHEISGKKDDLKISYESTAMSNKSKLLHQIRDSQQKDLHAGFTTIGPHRDDFSVIFKGNNITQIASRGELRTIVLALKLAELDFIESKLAKRPILLLDDVFSELDGKRREYLVSSISGQQTIITTTDMDKNLKPTYQLIDLSGGGYVT